MYLWGFRSLLYCLLLNITSFTLTAITAFVLVFFHHHLIILIYLSLLLFLIIIIIRSSVPSVWEIKWSQCWTTIDTIGTQNISIETFQITGHKWEAKPFCGWTGSSEGLELSALVTSSLSGIRLRLIRALAGEMSSSHTTLPGNRIILLEALQLRSETKLSWFRFEYTYMYYHDR